MQFNYISICFSVFKFPESKILDSVNLKYSKVFIWGWQADRVNRRDWGIRGVHWRTVGISRKIRVCGRDLGGSGRQEESTGGVKGTNRVHGEIEGVGGVQEGLTESRGLTQSARGLWGMWELSPTPPGKRGYFYPPNPLLPDSKLPPANQPHRSFHPPPSLTYFLSS